MPIHPMLVHFPIALAIFIPVTIFVALIFFKRSENQRTVWTVMFALCFLLTASSFIAGAAGENEEDRVEKIVGHHEFEEHEETAEIFTWATLLPLIFTGFLIFKSNSLLKGGAVVSAIVISGLAMQTGHAGAELVYKHNAGSAYSVPGSASGEGSPGILVLDKD